MLCANTLVVDLLTTAVLQELKIHGPSSRFVDEGLVFLEMGHLVPALGQVPQLQQDSKRVRQEAAAGARACMHLPVQNFFFFDGLSRGAVLP